MICPFCRSENIEGVEVCANCGRDLVGLDIAGGIGNQPPAFLGAPLGSLSGRQPARVGPSDPVSLAVRQMQNGGTSCVLVVEGEAVVGIITATDILLKVVGPNEDLNAVQCRQVMTPEPTLLDSGDSVALAINKMASGEYRHIPVLEDGQPSLIVDVSDVFRHLSPYLV